MNLLFPTKNIELNLGETITFNQVTGKLDASRIEGDLPAGQSSYDNTESGLEATNVQDAIDEVNTKIENIPSVDAYTKEESDEKYATKSELSNKADVSAIPTKTSELQNDSGFAQIDDSETANNKTWSGQKINNAILDVMPSSVASGNVANFDTSLEFALMNLNAEIKCIKTGNVISGYNEIVFKHYADDVADADTITIPLLSDEYDGELIITDKGNGFASVKKIINGKRYDLSTWTWHLHTNGFYYATKPNEMAICASDVKPDILAEKYDIQTGQWIYSHGSSYGYLGQNGGAIWITDSTTPIGHIVAPLTEPIVTELTDIPSIFAFSGENNISANSGSVSVSFRLSLTDAIDEKADKNNTYTKEEVDELITRVGDKGLYIQAKKNVLSSPQTFPPKIDNKKNAVLEFLGYFSTFTSLTFGRGYGAISGSYVVVDDTNVTVYYSAPAQQRAQAAHGLTISDFIHVAVKQYDNAHADIQITTASGMFELTNATWVGCQGSVYANVGSEMTDVCVTSVYKDLNEKLFLYGDSYVSLDDPARYTYYLIKNGYTHFFLDGWAGRASGDALASFKATIPYATPDYAVWGMGMNNPDVGEINSNWLNDTQEFLSICEEKDITPILTVTPCTPTVDNTYKNAWVKASGYRYVDFAKSVGAESAGSSWYAGMLYSDNVHPTTLGAKALYARLISDAPEFIK